MPLIALLAKLKKSYVIHRVIQSKGNALLPAAHQPEYNTKENFAMSSCLQSRQKVLPSAAEKTLNTTEKKSWSSATVYNPDRKSCRSRIHWMLNRGCDNVFREASRTRTETRHESTCRACLDWPFSVLQSMSAIGGPESSEAPRMSLSDVGAQAPHSCDYISARISADVINLEWLTYIHGASMKSILAGTPPLALLLQERGRADFIYIRNDSCGSRSG